MDSQNLEDVQEQETTATASGPRHPEQEHPEQDAHGGSMAPGLVDGTGNLVGDPPDGTTGA